jgi:putative addiction module killer protein
MKTIHSTDIFTAWVEALPAPSVQGRIMLAIDKLALGLGDVAPIGEGVSEMRLHFGPGYRLYFVARGKEIVILLCGGTKRTQAKDIKEAKQMAKQLE